jgi:hypothetical protein
MILPAFASVASLLRGRKGRLCEHVNRTSRAFEMNQRETVSGMRRTTGGQRTIENYKSKKNELEAEPELQESFYLFLEKANYITKNIDTETVSSRGPCPSVGR